jgi:hypothetical protein
MCAVDTGGAHDILFVVPCCDIATVSQLSITSRSHIGLIGKKHGAEGAKCKIE